MVAISGVGIEYPEFEIARRQHRIWQRLAYATYYGNLNLAEAASMDAQDLGDYMEAVSEIIQQENEASKR